MRREKQHKTFKKSELLLFTPLKCCPHYYCRTFYEQCLTRSIYKQPRLHGFRWPFWTDFVYEPSLKRYKCFSNLSHFMAVNKYYWTFSIHYYNNLIFKYVLSFNLLCLHAVLFNIIYRVYIIHFPIMFIYRRIDMGKLLLDKNKILLHHAAIHKIFL